MQYLYSILKTILYFKYLHPKFPLQAFPAFFYIRLGFSKPFTVEPARLCVWVIHFLNLYLESLIPRTPRTKWTTDSHKRPFSPNPHFETISNVKKRNPQEFRPHSYSSKSSSKSSACSAFLFFASSIISSSKKSSSKSSSNSSSKSSK